MTAEPVPDRSSLVQVKIGNRVYDAHYSKSCLVCNHPARMRVEEMLVEGFAYAKIAEAYSEVELQEGGITRTLPPLTWQNVRSHYTAGHLPTESAAVRHLVEERAKELGLGYEDLTRKAVDQVLVARTVMTKGYEQLSKDQVVPTVRETLAAADLLHKFEMEAATSLDAEAWGEAFEVYFLTAQAVMPAAMWEEFTKRLATNPILRALQAKAERENQGTIEGEVVHDIGDEDK